MVSEQHPPEPGIADPLSGRSHGSDGGTSRRSSGNFDTQRKGPPVQPGYRQHLRDASKPGMGPMMPSQVPPFSPGFIPTPMSLVQDFRAISLDPGMPGAAARRMVNPHYGVVHRPPVMMSGQYGVAAPWSTLPNGEPPGRDAPSYDGPYANSPRELASDPGMDSGSQTGGKKFLGNTPREVSAPMSARTPQSAEREICKYFLRTGTCGYGDKCRYYHPRNAQRPRLNSLGYPLRDGERPCAFYLKHNWCGFGATCKFHHPEMQAGPAVGVPGMVPVNTMPYTMPAQLGGAPGGGYYPSPQPFHGMAATPGAVYPAQLMVPGPLPPAPVGWPGNVPSPWPQKATKGSRHFGTAESGRKPQSKGTSVPAALGAQQAQLQSPGGSSTPSSDASTSSVVDSSGLPKAGPASNPKGPGHDEKIVGEENAVTVQQRTLIDADSYGDRVVLGPLEGVAECEEEEEQEIDTTADGIGATGTL